MGLEGGGGGKNGSDIRGLGVVRVVGGEVVVYTI